MKVAIGIILIFAGLFLLKIKRDGRIRKFLLEFTEGKDYFGGNQKASSYILTASVVLILVGLFAIFGSAFKQVLGGVIILTGILTFFYRDSVMNFIGKFFDQGAVKTVNNILIWPIKKILNNSYISKKGFDDSWILELIGLPIVVVGLVTLMLPLSWFLGISAAIIVFSFALTRKKDVPENISDAIIIEDSIPNELFSVMIFSDGPGKTNPEDRVIVQKGDSLNISFIPDPGCGVAAVFIDGMPTKDYNRETNSYMFKNIGEKHTVRVEFYLPLGNV